MSTAVHPLLEGVAKRLEGQSLLRNPEFTHDLLTVWHDHPEAEAGYLVEIDGPSVWVGWFTADRWLSGSVEADLVHTGDDLADLIEEELVELGGKGPIHLEHFRDEQKRFIFRNPLRMDDLESGLEGKAEEVVARLVEAYARAFSELGDLKPEEE